MHNEKNMKKYFIVTLLAFMCSLALIQCQKKCVSKELGVIRFTQSDLNIVPYAGTENLLFKDSIGDSISEHPEVVPGRISDYNNYYDGYCCLEDVCPPDHYVVQGNYTHFEGKDYKTSIEVDLGFEDPFSTPLKKSIGIVVSYEDSQQWYFSGYFNFDSLKLTNPSSGRVSIVTFNDILKIGPKQFFKVYTLKQNEDPQGLKNIQIVYYSINSGVVGFKTDQGHLWYFDSGL